MAGYRLLIYIQVGTMAGISEDVENLRVNRGDFIHALDEVKPAFGVSEEELQAVIQNGIIHYNQNIEVWDLTETATAKLSDTLLTRYSPYFEMGSYLLNKSRPVRIRKHHWCLSWYDDEPVLIVRVGPATAHVPTS